MKVGPNITQSGLVFGIDVGNHRYYPGEPTTNLLPNASTNAIPKLGNGWGTYNTNQYGSGNFFSIGTVSSVSNNIVTMSLAHSLRTYDVMRPQTTGGGVTANTDYFIKKVSSTQFSLHAYNNSQDGSQGYINTSTGLHKVHDSIANDTRISINSTDFPTMWWGAPHLPNAGLVKEWIPNGFTNPLTGEVTDCLRQHITRDSGADHMAYNVDASFTVNSPVYCSFWARSVDSGAVGKSINFYHYTYGVQSPTAYAVGCTLGAVGVWQRFGYTFTSPNNTAISYWFNPDGPYKYDIANIQIEQKDHPTRFTTGTRSSTQSLVDVARGGAIDVANVSFNSNGQITFDGTNDYIDFFAPSLGSIATIEMVAKIGSGYSGKMFFGWISYDVWCGNGHLGYNTGNGDVYGISSSSVSSLGLVGNWEHYVFEMRTDVSYTNNKIYINGVQQSLSQQQSSEGSKSFNSGNGRIAVWKNDLNYCMPMDCHVFRVYNRALSQEEITQNYISYKGRFGIS